MSTELRKLLDNAKGVMENIIAIVLDIRGFTPFCLTTDSFDVANFLKRIYIRIIDEYFPEAAFYKPTGDGLLIVIRYNPESLKDTITSTIQSCLNLVQNFGKLREGDNMIYFPTPDKIGMGISRGTACCISSGETIIDYSGKAINLASRLNDFARPCGIVFDFSLGWTLFPEEIQKLFLFDNVYVRGIAEDKPIAIYYTKEYTIISPSRREPLREPRWVTPSHTLTYGEIKGSYLAGTTDYNITLKEKPLDDKQIYVDVGYQTAKGRVWRDFDVGLPWGAKYIERGTKRYIRIKYNELVEKLEGSSGHAELKEDTRVSIEISYPTFESNA